MHKTQCVVVLAAATELSTAEWHAILSDQKNYMTTYAKHIQHIKTYKERTQNVTTSHNREKRSLVVVVVARPYGLRPKAAAAA